MPRANSKLYNFRTRVWYKILHQPIRLKPVYDSHTKDPILTVVFLHCISPTAYTWRTTIRQFTKKYDLKNIRFIAIDLLGFGAALQSKWLDYDYDDYDRALDSTLKHLRITSPVVLIGHSMGSLIAADYAVNFQPSVDLSHLILVSPPILLSEELAKLPDRVYTKSYASLHKLAQDKPVMEVIANFIQRFSSFSSRYIKTPAFGRSMDNIILNHNNYRTFTKLRIPTLIIHGHFDPLVIRSNLKHLADVNSKYINFISVMGHHDISAQKRSKILIELKKILREEKAS